MTIIELGAIGELVGGAAVILTLIYLAFQLRQNTTSLQTSAYQQWVALHGQTFAAAQDKEMSKILFRGSEDSRGLSEDTFPRFMLWMRQYMYMQQAQYYLFVKGVIDRELWESNLRDLIGVYRFPGVHQFWHAGFKTGLTHQFVNVVESSDKFATMMLWNKEQGFYPSPHHIDD